MLANDVLRRIRYIFNYNDQKMIDIFNSGGLKVSLIEVAQWLKKDEDSEFKKMNDLSLAHFLNGLINEKRGKKEGVILVPEKTLTNNIILRKLTIALNLKSEDTIKILGDADLRVSKHELSAFFRKPDHKHYRECLDQILRNFLIGLEGKF
ncbi:MAG: hypothetical protein ACJAT2_000197 [Bacteriovoracaceae bacterium]|jgi:uncharacterized protein YehS (DUF1456 family)